MQNFFSELSHWLQSLVYLINIPYHQYEKLIHTFCTSEGISKNYFFECKIIGWEKNKMKWRIENNVKKNYAKWIYVRSTHTQKVQRLQWLFFYSHWNYKNEKFLYKRFAIKKSEKSLLFKTEKEHLNLEEEIPSKLMKHWNSSCFTNFNGDRNFKMKNLLWQWYAEYFLSLCVCVRASVVNVHRL